MIYAMLETEVRTAISNPENRNEDGTINWNFVDSDCYMSGLPKSFKDDSEFYEAFNDIADMIEAEMPVDNSVQMELV